MSREINTLTLQAYTIRLLILSIIVTGLFPLATLFVPGEYITPGYPFLGVFFFGLTWLIHRFLTQKGMRMNTFVNAYMLVTIVKLLLFMGIILVYALVRKADALSFTVAFLVFYLFFSVFEIICLLKHHRSAADRS